MKVLFYSINNSVNPIFERELELMSDHIDKGDEIYEYSLTDLGISRALILGADLLTVLKLYPEQLMFPELYNAISKTEQITGKKIFPEAIVKAAKIHTAIYDGELSNDEYYSIVHGALYGYVLHIVRNESYSLDEIEQIRSVWAEKEKSLEKYFKENNRLGK